jgi:pSer/pThr/pTyr-binding forkhead associated (FHA) protein
MNYSIRFIKGPNQNLIYKLSSQVLTIGRDNQDKANDINVQSESVSRQHATIQIVDKQIEFKIISKHTTKINGEKVFPRSESYILHDGSVVQLGSDVVFIVEKVNEKRNPPTPRPEDLVEPPREKERKSWLQILFSHFFKHERSKVISTEQQKSAETNIPPTELATNVTEKKTKTSNTEGTKIYKQDDIKKAWVDDKRNEIKHNVMLWSGLIIFFVVLAISYLICFRQPSKELTWPKIGQEWQISQISLNIPQIDPPLQIKYPGFSAKKQISKDSNSGIINNIILDTYIGQSQDVSCHIMVEINQDSNILILNRKTAFTEWQKQKQSQDKEIWHFEGTPSLKFEMPDNGFPYLATFYSRLRTNKKIFGQVRYYRHADWQIVILIEMPAEERWRGEEFLSNTGNSFLGCSSEFVSVHWEGTDMLDEKPLNELLAETDRLIKEDTPQHWNRIEKNLQSVLIRSYKDSHTSLYERAIQMLSKLRKNKNEVYSKFSLMVTQYPPKDRHIIREECASIFTSIDDRRHYKLQNKEWEED